MSESAVVICSSAILLGVRWVWFAEVVLQLVRRLSESIRVVSREWKQFRRAAGEKKSGWCLAVCLANGDNDVNFGRSREATCDTA
jgi:hypothetical protein